MIQTDIKQSLAENYSQIQDLRNSPESVSTVRIDITTDSELVDEGYIYIDHVGDRPKLSMYTEPFEFDLTLHLTETDELPSIKDELYDLVEGLYRANDAHVVSQDYPAKRLSINEELSPDDLEHLLSRIE